MQTIYGRNVQIAQAYPLMQCSASFARIQAPALVASTNAWMREFFGCDTLMPDGVVWELNRETLVMTQATFEQVKAAIAKDAK